MKELGFAYIYGPSYSPDFNGIEFFFSGVKSRIKKARLRAILREEEIDLKKEVIKAFHDVDCLKISKCI